MQKIKFFLKNLFAFQFLLTIGTLHQSSKITSYKEVTKLQESQLFFFWFVDGRILIRANNYGSVSWRAKNLRILRKRNTAINKIKILTDPYLPVPIHLQRGSYTRGWWPVAYSGFLSRIPALRTTGTLFSYPTKSTRVGTVGHEKCFLMRIGRVHSYPNSGFL